MVIATVSERGQISIPAAARKKLGIKPRQRVIVEVGENEIVIRPAKSVLELGGILRDHAKGLDWETERALAMDAVGREVEDEAGH
jgi:AbrB family looped-hinge helix DNA binding protein